GRAKNNHPGRNNAEDAKRHAEWNADMTQKMGANRAKDFADAHERDGLNEQPELVMDVINNHNSRVITEALPNVPPSEIANQAQERGILQNFPVEGRVFR